MYRNLYLIRHGESIGNVNPSVYSTYKDWQITLTEKGERQAKDAFSFFKNRINVECFDVWYSPYIRAVQTKDILIGEFPKKHKPKNITMNVLLREREWGKLHDIVVSGGKTEDHFDFFYRPENGESFADLYQRVVIFDTMLQTQDTTQTSNIIVAHGEFLKVYIMYKLGWTMEDFNRCKTPRNGKVYHLFGNGNKWQLDYDTSLPEKH